MWMTGTFHIPDTSQNNESSLQPSVAVMHTLTNILTEISQSVTIIFFLIIECHMKHTYQYIQS